MSVTLKAKQGISGIGVYIFGLGLSDLLFVRFVGTPLPVSPLPTVNIPLLSKIPAVGRMFFQQNLLVYLAFLLVPAVAFVLYHTNYGTKVLAVGENPAAADSLGISVTRIRYSTVIFGSTMAGLAGTTCSCSTASSRRTSPRAQDSSPSRSSTSAPGGLPGS